MNDELFSVILSGLTDYTIDQRGDIGSTLRLEASKAVHRLVQLHQHDTEDGKIAVLVHNVSRLSAEKLDKIRFQAWSCLQTYWQNQQERMDLPTLKVYA